MRAYFFLTGKYLPSPGATGLCVHSVAKKLAADGNKVTTICYADDNCKNNASEIDGVHVVRIPAPSYFYRTQYNVDIFRRIDSFKSRYGKLIHLKKYPLRSSRLLKRFANTCLKQIGESDEATLVASYVPLEAVAALELIKRKRPKVKMVYYSTDTLSNEQGEGGILSDLRRQQLGFQWENRIFSYCDCILIMECHKDHYYSEQYKKYQNKMKVVNFPLFEMPKCIGVADSEKPDNLVFNGKVGAAGERTLVYAGNLYSVLRNPQFACDVLLKVTEKTDYKVVIMGGGDCDDILADACKKSGGRIQFLGMQPHDVAASFIAEAVALLSIGNAESPMTPSKIYEYMATGKPIIHFYSWNEDSCIKPLEQYENSLLIKDGSKDAETKVTDFLANAKTMDYRNIEKIFYTSMPEYTAELIKQV